MKPSPNEVRFTIEGVSLLGSGPLVDIDIDTGVIASIRRSLSSQGRDLIALPGLVDLHTHLREPGKEAAETIATGTRAAAAGGYTDVFAMANTDPVTDTTERVQEIRERAANSSARVHPVAAATLSLHGRTLVDIENLRGVGVTVFSDDGRCVENEGLVFELLGRLAHVGGVFAQHAQSSAIVGDGVINGRVSAQVGCPPWPTAGEEAVVARDVALARATGGWLHVCHVSTRRTLDVIRWAKGVGAPVSAEVTPHHLTLTDHDALAKGPALKVNPPLRSEDDIQALRQGLVDGTIDTVGTDHAPHTSSAKDLPWRHAAFGMTGIETALAVVADVLTDANGNVDWVRLVEVMSTAPARIGCVTPAVSSIRVGDPANLLVVEKGGPWISDPAIGFSKSTNAAFASCRFRHRIVLTVMSGRITHSL